MRSIETNTKFEVDINNKFQINQTKMTNESKFGEKLSAKYSLNCTNGGAQVCAKPIDVTLCTEICGIDMEFGRIKTKGIMSDKLFNHAGLINEVEGIKFKFNVMGADVALSSGKNNEASGAAGHDEVELLGDNDIIALEICGEYCGYNYQLAHLSTKDATGRTENTKAYVSKEQNGFNIVLGSDNLSDNANNWVFGVESNMIGYAVGLGYKKADTDEVKAYVEKQLDDHSKACLRYDGDDVSAKLTYGQ